MATLSAIKIGGWIGRGQSEITRELLDPFCTPWGPGGALGGPGGPRGGPWGGPWGAPLFPPIPPLDSYAVGSTSGAVYTGLRRTVVAARVQSLLGIVGLLAQV